MTATRTRYSVLLFVTLAAFITYFDRVCIAVAAPLIQSDLALSQYEMGWVFTMFYLAYAIFEIPASWAGDHWGQRRTLARIVGGWSLFTMLTGMVRGYASLLVIRFLFGAAESGAFPTLSRALARWFPPYERSFANGLMWMGARLGGAISPPLAVMAIAWVGWRGTFFIFGAVGLVWVAVCALWYRDDPANHPRVNAVELQKIRAGAAPARPGVQTLAWKKLLFNRDLLILCATYFASGFGFQFFVTWLPTYLTTEHGLTLTRSGFYAALPLLAGALGCALGGIVSDAITRWSGSLLWGRRIVGAGGFLLGAAGFTFAISARTPEFAIACLAFASAAHDLTLPVVWATCTDLGGRFGGTAGGWLNLASSLSGMLAPVASAGLAQWFGSFHAVFWVTTSLYLAGALLWLFIDPRKPAIT
ncbi:MAG TPA: MFS transporter [Bryobacteraceae bacterium]|nr:MFS transporter [Bryobacteraceae bacterium]